MKNIIIKIDDETYRKASVRATEAGTSVSAMTREFLKRDEGKNPIRETERIEALESWYAIVDRQSPEKGSEPLEQLAREEIYKA